MQYFVTGIGTGVGKSLVTAALAHRYKIPAFKPVLSGYGMDGGDDAALLAQVTGRSVEALSHWRFAAPLSPHLAAQKEGKSIDPKALEDWCREQLARQSSCLIEGVGGVLVPLHETYTVADWISALNLPVILVASSYLGAMNHTLLSLEVMQQRGISPKTIIVSQATEKEDAGLEDTLQTLRGFVSQEMELVALPRLAGSDTPWKEAADLLSLNL
jgi:dethiobiotin synthetase